MVWQEFMFACAMYPRDRTFLQDVREEVAYQVKRLMHHASIVLWSGNNENEAALGWFDITRENRDLYVVSFKLFIVLTEDQVDYSELYFNIVHDTLIEFDNIRPFWPRYYSMDRLF